MKTVHNYSICSRDRNIYQMNGNSRGNGHYFSKKHHHTNQNKINLTIIFIRDWMNYDYVFKRIDAAVFRYWSLDQLTMSNGFMFYMVSISHPSLSDGVFYWNDIHKTIYPFINSSIDKLMCQSVVFPFFQSTQINSDGMVSCFYFHFFFNQTTPAFDCHVICFRII